MAEADDDSSCSVTKTMNISQIDLKSRGQRSNESGEKDRDGQTHIYSSKYLNYNSNAPKSGFSQLSLTKPAHTTDKLSRNRLNQDAMPPFTRSQQNILSHKAFNNASSLKSLIQTNTVGKTISELSLKSVEEEKHLESECNVDQDEADELLSE
jgi:hypothetical protein